MAKHSSSRTSAAPLLQLAALAVGATLNVVAWTYLVRAAIQFGVMARDGQERAWLFTATASLGAIVCLVLFMTLVGRALRTLGFISDYRPRRAAPPRRRREAGRTSLR